MTSLGTHIWNVVTKASARLFSLNMLRRAKVAPRDIIKIYCSKIRPVLEYATAVWHPGLTSELNDLIEHVQERALRIASPYSSYEDACKIFNIPTLFERRKSICQKLFKNMQLPEDKLFNLLPPRKENIHDIRNFWFYSTPTCQTNRFKNSFVPYVLYNLQ